LSLETSDFAVAALRSLPLALRRLVVWRAMTEVAGGRPIAFEHVRAALTLLAPDADGLGIDAPGQRVQRIGASLVLTSRLPGEPGARPRTKSANLFHYALSVPGEVRLAEAGCVVTAEPRPRGAGAELASSAGDSAVAIVRSDVCSGSLAVRNRRPGDRFRPVGLGGRKKLQDFFVDRKVARDRRDAVPIVVDERDRIVWVAGYAIDDQFRVTDPMQAVLILRLKPGGGPA
jgi:tRNA(Ile)-lysidine synthase